MAGHDSASSKGKAYEEIDVPIFSAENMQSNMKIIFYSRTFMSIIGGVIAGILGFTGLSGFILYFLIMAITSIGLVAKTGFSVNSYFGSWNQIVLDGFLGGLMALTLFFPFPFRSHSCFSGHLLMTSCIFSEWVFPVTNPRMMKARAKPLPPPYVLPDYNFTNTALRGFYTSLTFASLFSSGFKVWP